MLNVSSSEIQALERLINREASRSAPDAAVHGELMRLRNRLLRLRAEASESDRRRALAPLESDPDFAALKEKLENAADRGGRPERRSLALFHLFMNEPEKALEQWRKLGQATPHDMPHLLVSAYLEFALGEYGAAREDLAAASSMMDHRTSLAISAPVFCSNIAGYRIFFPRPEGSLLPGEDVLIYVEVEGAEFENAPGGNVCKLMFGLRLRNSAQLTLWAEPNFGEYSPLFSGPVRDLHAALAWRVPGDLEPGRYTLAVEAADEVSRRRGENSISFQVARRETNPDRRASAAPPPAASAGGGETFADPAGRLNLDPRMFELLRRHEQGQRAN